MHGSMWRELETERGTCPWSPGWDNRPGNRGKHEGPRTYRQEKPPRQFPTLLTHICGKSRDGRFWLRRNTISKRLRAKLREISDELSRRRHQPIPVQGQWLASVVRGHRAYYAVPGNTEAIEAFRNQATRHWYKALRRRSQRTGVNWARMGRIAARWLPPVRVMHPHPAVRLAART
jgi:RNA-directed DNA polymerase